MTIPSGRTTRWAACVLALFLCGAGPAVAAEAPQPGTSRGVQTLESDHLKKKAVDDADKKGPRDLFRRLERKAQKRREVDANIAAQIDTLQMLIETAPEDDPDLPKYMMTLGDVYWEKADTYYDRAYDLALERKIFEAGERGDEGLETKLRREQASFLVSEKEWRERAIGVYRSIEKRFANYSDLDMVYYYLGYQLTQLTRTDEAYQYFRKILERFPSSKYTPDALYHIGDYYFDKNQFDVALRFYEKVEEFPKAVAYPMALYKQGWCFFNMGDYEEALKRFLRVIIYAKSEDAKGLPFRLELERDARQDLVRAYSAVGTPEKAIAFFEKIAPEIKYDLAETLGQMYYAEGEWQKSTRLYHLLLKERKETPRRALYWLGIAENAYHDGNKKLVVKTVRTLMKRYRVLTEGAANDKLRKETEERLEGLIKTAATAYHKEAEKYQDSNTIEQTAYLYEAYLALFPDAKDAYEVTWNLAVLNEQNGKWDVAAAMYQEVLRLRPKGEHAADAAKAILLNYYNMVQDETTDIKDEGEVVTEARPYTEKYVKVLETARQYIDVARSDDPDLAKAHFVVARIAYRFNHFDEAIEHLKTVTTNFRGDELAQPAARMLLSCYALQRDIDNLNLYADRFAADPQINSGDLSVLIARIRNREGFNRCFKYEKSKEYVATARCFLQYVKDFPTTEFKTEAFFQAALAYNRAKLIEKSIQTLGELYNDNPQDKFAPTALFSIAEIYRTIAVYSESARFFELYVAQHPGHTYVKKALQRAIIFRKALRNYPQAIKNIDRFISLFGDDEAVPRLELDRAILFRKYGNTRAARKALETFVRRPPDGSDTTVILRARLELGRTYHQADRNAKKAKARYLENVETYRGMPEDQRRKLDAVGLATVAESHFLVGQMYLDELSRLKFKGSEKAIGRTLKRKLELIGEATRTFAEVVAYGDPNWAIAGLTRAAAAYEQLAKDITEAPVPRKFRGDAAEIYRQTLTEKAEPIKQKAIESYRGALKMASAQRWFNTFTHEAVDALARLDYTFPFLKEYVVRPTTMRHTVAAPPIGAYLEAEDETLSRPEPTEGGPGAGGTP